MNITKDGDLIKKMDKVWSNNKNWKEFKSTLKDSDFAMLLEEAVYFINQVPNKKYKTSTGETSYELASKISEYLNKLK